MQAFFQHVGANNIQHLENTVTTERTIVEMVRGIPTSSPEKDFFNTSTELRQAFSTGAFNCWGLMKAAEERFTEMEVGDLVLMLPHIGKHDSGIHQIGVVKVKCPVRCYEASRLLWPHIDDPKKMYPFLFFFNTEVGFRRWDDFCKDLGMDANFNPRGWFLKIDTNRFDNWNGVEGYLKFLRSKCGFKPL